jgi:hypothetical protein
MKAGPFGRDQGEEMGVPSGGSSQERSGLSELLEELDSHYRSYAGGLQELKPIGSLIATILLIAVLGFVLPEAMLYIDLSRDSTIMRAEANLTTAMEALNRAKATPSTLKVGEFLDSQSKLMGEQAIILADLEKKIPKPDWIGSSMKYLGLIGALIAAIGGLSTIMLAWRTERRETARFLLELGAHLKNLEEKRSHIVTP